MTWHANLRAQKGCAETISANVFKVAPYSFSTVRELISKSRDDASFQTLRNSRARDHALKCRQTWRSDFQNVFLVRVAWIGSGFKTFIE